MLTVAPSQASTTAIITPTPVATKPFRIALFIGHKSHVSRLTSGFIEAMERAGVKAVACDMEKLKDFSNQADILVLSFESLSVQGFNLLHEAFPEQLLFFEVSTSNIENMRYQLSMSGPEFARFMGESGGLDDQNRELYKRARKVLGRKGYDYVRCSLNLRTQVEHLAHNAEAALGLLPRPTS